MKRLGLVLPAALLVVATACGGGGGSDDRKVGVELREYEVTTDKLSVPAGEVTFDIRNAGGFVHELAVVKTDLAAAQLPTDTEGRLDEHGAGLRLIDQVESIDPDSTATLAVDLEPGRYLLVCNQAADATEGTPAHFTKKMYATFEITPAS